MKRLLAIILAVLSIVAVLDWGIGKAMDAILPQISNQGNTGRTYFSLYEVNTPIVIVGSSRAAHHYVSQMIEDSIGLPAYNVGRDGCFFDYNCCVINTILDRYAPRLIIWETGKDSMFGEGGGPLESLYPYYKKNSWITSTINSELPWTETVRLSSRVYRYNSVIHRIAMRYLERHSFANDTEKGYMPLKPKKLLKPLELGSESWQQNEVDEAKVERFRAILRRARDKGVKLIVVDSPKYKIISGKCVSADVMKSICDEYGARFFDNTQMKYFLKRPWLFNDATHLNDAGAKVYTEIFLKEISNRG
jgi:hypothetical protein